MLKAVTWCAKCLFLYFLVVIVAIRFSWIFTTPVLALATSMHWTAAEPQFAFVLSYFLPIFAVAGFLIGLIPFGKLGKALVDLYHSYFASILHKAPVRTRSGPPHPLGLASRHPRLPHPLLHLAIPQLQCPRPAPFSRPLRALLRPPLRPNRQSTRRPLDLRPLPLHRPHALSHGRSNRSPHPLSPDRPHHYYTSDDL